LGVFNFFIAMNAYKVQTSAFCTKNRSDKMKKKFAETKILSALLPTEWVYLAVLIIIGHSVILM